MHVTVFIHFLENDSSVDMTFYQSDRHVSIMLKYNLGHDDTNHNDGMILYSAKV